jgi:hypothetical protein
MVPRPSGLVRLAIGDGDRSATADDYVQWAIDALTEGYDAPALRKLAGLVPPANWFEAKELFEQVVIELRLQVPNSEQARRTYLATVAVGLVDKSISTEEGLEAIHRMVVSPLDHPADLQPWCDIWDELSPGQQGILVGSDRDEAVLRLSCQTLGVETRPSVSCPCCRRLTLEESAAYDICRICAWEDDGQTDDRADEIRGGPNGSYSLSEARRLFRITSLPIRFN